MSTKLLFGWSLLLLAGCGPSALGPLVVDGHELHASLVTRKLEDAARLQVAPVLRDNPYLSTEAEFVHLIARIASQDRLGGKGVHAALYALYLGESEVGLYGLEAASPTDADRIEQVLRGIWSHNERLGRARVHRKGKVLVVVWNDGVSRSCWEAVNAAVVERVRGELAQPKLWLAQIPGWWSMMGSGDTRADALLDLERSIEAYRENNGRLPRPGTSVPIAFAPFEFMSRNEDLAREFFPPILEISYDDCLITDSSSVWDFPVDFSAPDLARKVLLVFNTDIGEIAEEGNIAAILDKIAEQRRGA